jgi:hypothetical protein
VQAVIGDRSTEIPVINSVLPMISVWRDGNFVELRLDYACGLPYNAEQIVYYRVTQDPQCPKPRERLPKPRRENKVPPTTLPPPTTLHKETIPITTPHQDTEPMQLLNELLDRLNELLKI